MQDIELYKKVHDQILDYVDEDVITRTAHWGYDIQQKLAKHGRLLVQSGAEECSPFMYAVSTAVIVGEFAKEAYNYFFNDETGIDLDLLDMDFAEIRGFLEKDIEQDRFRFLDGGNSIGLQDMWSAINEWKRDMYQSLTHIHGKENVDGFIFQSLLDVFENSSMTDTQKLSAYAYISNGFQI